MSQSRYIVGIFLLVLSFITIASAGISNGRCEAYTGSICSPLYSSTSTLVYINDSNYTQQQLEEQMRNFFGVFGAVEREQCGPYLLSMMCSQFLPTCTYNSQEQATPRYPCSDFCPSYGLRKPESTRVDPRYEVPAQCQKFTYFFELPSKEVSTQVKDYFRPVCWDTSTSLRPTTSEKSWPINYLAPSPIDVYRDTPGSIDVGSTNQWSRTEQAIISSNDESCDPLYGTFVTQATAVVQASESVSQFKQLRIDMPTHDCPNLLTALKPGEYSSSLEPCVIPCPTLTFTHKQYKQQDTLVIVFNSLSIVCLFILCISWTFFPALRLQNYVFYYIICISAMTVSLFILIPIARAQGLTIAESLCETPTKEYHMKGYPIVQGMVVSFTYMAATAWGLIMVFDIFVQVVVGRHMQKGSRDGILKERLYHAFSWFWGFYSVIGGLASQQIGATVIVGGSYALIIPSRFQQEQGVFNAGNPFFYYPLLILTFVSVFLMFAVLIKLIWFRAQTKTTGLRLATFVRLFIFIIANTFIICVFLVYSIDVNEKRDELERTTTNFTQCLHLASTFLGLSGDQLIEACGAQPDHPLDFNILLLTVVLFNGMGVIAFLIYGTTTDLLYSWFGALYLSCGCEVFKKYEKDFRRNRKSTKMNTTKTSQHPGGEKSKTSRSGHTGSTVGSGLLTSQHHHDSLTDRSAVDTTTNNTRRAMYDDDSRHNQPRSPSQDPKSRNISSAAGAESSTSGYAPRKTVFQYANNKAQQQQKRRAPAASVIEAAESPAGSVEMSGFDQ